MTVRSPRTNTNGTSASRCGSASGCGAGRGRSGATPSRQATPGHPKAIVKGRMGVVLYQCKRGKLPSRFSFQPQDGRGGGSLQLSFCWNKELTNLAPLFENNLAICLDCSRVSLTRSPKDGGCWCALAFICAWNRGTSLPDRWGTTSPEQKCVGSQGTVWSGCGNGLKVV